MKLSQVSNILTLLDRKLVEMCDKYGYNVIAVSCFDPKAEDSKYWSTRTVQFVVCKPDELSEHKGQIGGWPAIWHIIDVLGGGAGCGNHHQKQLVNNHKFSRVSYRKIDGEWHVFNIKGITNVLSDTFNI